MQRVIFGFAGYCVNEIVISNPRLGVDIDFYLEADLFSTAQRNLHFSYN